LAFDGGPRVYADASNDAYAAEAAGARVRFLGGPSIRSASALSFLHNGSEMELVAPTREAPKPHALEAIVDLQMRKPHLDPLSLIS
jgi:hypothetical protein